MRRKKIIIGICVLALVVAILIPTVIIPRPVMGRIVVISLSGTITTDGYSVLSDSTITPGLVRYYLTRAETDPAVRAIVFRIESPGGEVAPCQEILWEIERVKEKGFIIVVSMGGMAASGAYYISTAAHKIVALPTTLTGSIGVRSHIMNIEGLLEKLGIEIETFKGGKHKDMWAGFRELTPEEREIMQEMADYYHEHFIDVVVAGRELGEEEVRNLATGQLFTGTEAKELGLVDKLGDLNTAIDLAAKLAGIENFIVEYYQPPRLTLWALLGLADVLKMRISGLSAQDIILLEILSHKYRQPLFLYQS